MVAYLQYAVLRCVVTSGWGQECGDKKDVITGHYVGFPNTGL